MGNEEKTGPAAEELVELSVRHSVVAVEVFHFVADRHFAEAVGADDRLLT